MQKTPDVYRTMADTFKTLSDYLEQQARLAEEETETASRTRAIMSAARLADQLEAHGLSADDAINTASNALHIERRTLIADREMRARLSRRAVAAAAPSRPPRARWPRKVYPSAPSPRASDCRNRQSTTG